MRILRDVMKGRSLTPRGRGLVVLVGFANAAMVAAVLIVVLKGTSELRSQGRYRSVRR